MVWSHYENETYWYSILIFSPSLLNYYFMVKIFERFKLSIIAGFMSLVILIATVFTSYGQYKDPPEGYSEDPVSRMAPQGDGGTGCYTVIMYYCANAQFPGVLCSFNGVYGPPYSCDWSKCNGGFGTRHCVRK